MTKHKSMLLMLMAAGLLTVAVTACHDELDETERQAVAGDGRGIAVKGVGFYEAAPFVEDTVANHRPTLTTNVDDYVPDMDVIAYDTLDMAEMAASRRASAKAREKGYFGNSMDELMRKPSLATKLKQRQEARARARRASAGKNADKSSEGRVVAGHKPLVPVPHRDAADDGGKTRSYDTSDSTAIFVMGDSVGVYEVDAVGNVVKANVKFYYDAGLWNSETVLNYHEGHRYFAYHPYRTDAQLSDMGMTVDATATDHVNFFKTFWENWPVSDDQGVFEKYHACDFLAGEATWIEEKHELNFAMHHMMGMLQLEFGIARYYLDWAVSHRDSFPYWWTDTVTTILRDMKFLQKFDRKHRRITRPGSALSVVAIDNTWNLTFTPEKSITRGHYQHYDIGRTTSNTEDYYMIFYNQLGDILLKDGRLVHRHDHWRIQANDPVGIVVGTVYPSINPIPYQYAVVGPVEDETYNKHSLERDYLYDMQVIHSEGNEDKGMKVMRAKFVRCLIMSLKDLESGFDNSNNGIYFPASWGACWDWSEAFSHFPNTHVVGAPANNVWSSEELKSRVNNYWYPDISGWHVKTACENFNNNAGHVNTGGAYSKDSRQYTPNSGWFIGTVGQYQVAFCFGRVRVFCDSWKSWDGPDNDGAEPVRHYYDGAWWYQNTYNVTKRIGSGKQGATTYYDWDFYSKYYNKYTHRIWAYWEPSGDKDHQNPLPTMYHDWDRINNAMFYALGSTSPYNTLSGEYWTTTLYCDISQDDRFFPSANDSWDFDKKYWNYHSWNSFVTVNVAATVKTRGSNYWLGYSRSDMDKKIRPLMAL